jgi:outer membrane protein OmpA-like peptidoglycan-associated protein
MMKSFVFAVLLVLAVPFTHGQTKKDLLLEMESLKSELASTKEALNESKKNEKVSLAKAEAFEAQAIETQEANASLMKNLNSFTEASAQKSDNIGRTLETLKTKEAQLKRINDEFSRNDSIALLVLTGFKQTLGEDANIIVENGAVSTLLTTAFLFGANPASFAIEANAEISLEQIAKVIKNNPDMVVSIESQTPTGDNLDLVARRAAAVAISLINKYGVSPTIVNAYGKMGTSGSTFVRVHPKFDAFYFKVREDLKKAAK